MKRLFAFAWGLLLLCACAQEWQREAPCPEDDAPERCLRVALEGPTRAFLDEGLYPVWEVGERLSVYDPAIGSGRVFTVTEADGHSAVITGRLSEGVTRFDAIYPSKSAGAWSADGTNAPKLPPTQTIPASRKLCPDVLVSIAHSESPDEGVILFHNAVTLLQFRITREDIVSVTLELPRSSQASLSYTAAPEQGAFAPGEYFLAIDPGTYDQGLRLRSTTRDGVQYSRSATTPLEAAPGGLLRLGDAASGEGRHAYAITSEVRYATLQALLDETGLLEGLSPFLSAMATAMLNSYFPDRNSAVRAFNLTYPSLDPQGKGVTLSARVYVPEAALSDGRPLDGVAIANHGTICSNAECPTESADFEAMFAWTNFAIVMPDYYGFGASRDCPQAFLDPDASAIGNIGAYQAALQLLSDRGIDPGRVRYNYGYSQGGFNVVANLRYLTQRPELGIRFDKSFAGGSPFDVPATWQSYLQGGFGSAIGFVPLTLVSINEVRQLGLSYARLFQEPLLSNYRSWILSKDYTLSAINSRLAGKTLPDILTPAMIAGEGAEYDAVMAVCRSYSLTGGWKPEAGTQLHIFHSTQDDLVPFANYESMHAFLDEAAPDCEIHYQKGAYGGHVDACIYFILNLISEWN